MQLVLHVELGNDAMQTASDVSNAIQHSLSQQGSALFEPLNPHEAGAIRDGNGNTVGKWEVVA